MKLKPPPVNMRENTVVAHFFCALFSFCAHEFPAKSEKTRTFFAECTWYDTNQVNFLVSVMKYFSWTPKPQNIC